MALERGPRGPGAVGQMSGQTGSREHPAGWGSNVSGQHCSEAGSRGQAPAGSQGRLGTSGWLVVLRASAWRAEPSEGSWGVPRNPPLKHPSIVWGPVWELLLPLGSALPTWAQGLVPQRLLGARVGRPTRPLQQATLYCCAGQNGHCGDRNLQWVVGGPILGPGLSRKMTWLCLRLQRRKQHWVERGPNSS